MGEHLRLFIAASIAPTPGCDRLPSDNMPLQPLPTCPPPGFNIPRLSAVPGSASQSWESKGLAKITVTKSRKKRSICQNLITHTFSTEAQGKGNEFDILAAVGHSLAGSTS